MRPPGLRTARREDIPAIERLIDASVRVLQAGDYGPRQIEGALGSVFGVDRRLIEDGTYFCLHEHGALVACGGWSARRTLFGADGAADRDDARLDPKTDAARIRAFFVAPDCARQGLGSRLLQACEEAAKAAGFGSVELGATLTGEHLYAARGYAVLERTSARLPNGEELAIIRMGKTLSGAGPHAPAADPESRS